MVRMPRSRAIYRASSLASKFWEGSTSHSSTPIAATNGALTTY
jgi:hypothetical protein